MAINIIKSYFGTHQRKVGKTYASAYMSRCNEMSVRFLIGDSVMVFPENRLPEI